MNKFTNDCNVLKLQHELAIAREFTRQAEDEGASDDVIIQYMDAEDAIISQLLSLGCHLRDCR